MDESTVLMYTYVQGTIARIDMLINAVVVVVVVACDVLVLLVCCITTFMAFPAILPTE